MTQRPGNELLLLQNVVVGRYAVERELGRGGMGVVFLARDLALDRPVAIKLLAPILAANARSRERFLREARAAARLSHPHIIPVHAVEDHGPVVFFVMSFVDGESLGERIRRTGPLARTEASRIMQEVAWALSLAHAVGVVHRDVKPDNIMLERGTGRAIVMDFGIASLQDGGSDSGSTAAGTPHYMSPEQAAGDPVDGRSDVYALGLTMFFALTGERPFEEPPSPGALRAGLHLAPPVAALRPDLPVGFAAAIDRCLAPDPQNRFPTAEALAAALAAARPAAEETPLPVAAWVRDAEAAGTEIGAAVVTAGISIGVMGVMGFDSMAGWVFYPIATLLIGMGLVRMGDLVFRTRQLRQQGYGLASVRPALALERQRADEEARLLERAAQGPSDRLGVFLATQGAKIALSAWMLSSDTGWISVLGAAGVLLFPANTVRLILRRWPKGRGIWSRLLSGRLGKFFFGIAERWPGTRALPAPDAPTEVLLGGAAERLLAALPPDVRREFRDLPATIARLQADAAGDSDRRAPALAAIEAIRLDLLRLQADASARDQLTKDLAEARSLADRVDRLLDRPASG